MNIPQKRSSKADPHTPTHTGFPPELFEEYGDPEHEERLYLARQRFWRLIGAMIGTGAATVTDHIQLIDSDTMRPLLSPLAKIAAHPDKFPTLTEEESRWANFQDVVGVVHEGGQWGNPTHRMLHCAVIASFVRAGFLEILDCGMASPASGESNMGAGLAIWAMKPDDLKTLFHACRHLDHQHRWGMDEAGVFKRVFREPHRVAVAMLTEYALILMRDDSDSDGGTA